MGSRRPSGQPGIPTRRVLPALAGSYLRKAEQHLALALQALAGGRWDSAVLLAVHAGISATDAVCVGKFGLRSASQSHGDQVRLLRQMLAGESTTRTSNQLAALIDRKNTVEYEARRCTEKDAEVATRQAERIVQWARTTLM